jgi:hypothetical protein
LAVIFQRERSEKSAFGTPFIVISTIPLVAFYDLPRASDRFQRKKARPSICTLSACNFWRALAENAFGNAMVFLMVLLSLF